MTRTAKLVAMCVGVLLMTAGPVRSGLITEISLGDFVNPKVLGFESASLGNVSGTDSLFTDFGISEASVDTTDATFDDEYNSNSTGNALWADVNGLKIVDPGDTELANAVNHIADGAHLDYVLKFSETHSRFGFNTVDQANVRLDIQFFNAGSSVGSILRTLLGTNPLYLHNTDAFDEVRLLLDSNTGHGIDNLTLEAPISAIPEPSSLALLFIGTTGGVLGLNARRKRKVQKTRVS